MEDESDCRFESADVVNWEGEFRGEAKFSKEAPNCWPLPPIVVNPCDDEAIDADGALAKIFWPKTWELGERLIALVCTVTSLLSGLAEFAIPLLNKDESDPKANELTGLKICPENCGGEE